MTHANRFEFHRSAILFALLLTMLSVLTGCEAPVGPETAPAIGTLTYNGQPVAGAMITFHPATAGQGQTCQVPTDENGKFVMRTGDPGGKPKEGAVPGDYQVAVIKQELEPGQMAPRNLLPPKYISAKTSELKVSVVAGINNEFELQLTD